MAYLQNTDYDQVIRSDEISILTGDDNTILRAVELSAQAEVESYLRQRYEVLQIFKQIQTFSIATSYKVDDLIKWSETAWVTGTTYAADAYVSYSGYIYKSLQASNTGNTPDSEPTWWAVQAENDKLWYVRQDTVGNYPTDTYSFTSNAYTDNHNEILGWDKTTTLYFKKFSTDIVKIYTSAANRTNDVDSVGVFDYDVDSIEFPKTVEVCKGDYEDMQLGGFIDITSFIDDDQEWDVAASNYFTLGDNRNEQIKMYTIDIALYHLHSRINPRNIPDFRIARRDEAINWLKMIAKGTISADLPIHTNNERGQNINFGSKPKLKNDY